VRGLRLDRIVRLLPGGNCQVYDDESQGGYEGSEWETPPLDAEGCPILLPPPPIGEGLNRRAVITLEGVWPDHEDEAGDVVTGQTAGDAFGATLRAYNEGGGAEFRRYDAQTGTWEFAVEHF
jgi:hypothetical protein